MEATSLVCCSSSTLPFSPFSSHPKTKLINPQKRRAFVAICAARREAHDQNYSGRIVDEDMIVLRKRIHEMKIVERNYEPPADWMEWEKHYFASYDSMICGMMGVLQSQLMNTRPSVALGIIALISLSVPFSTSMVLFQVMEMAKMVLGGIHLT
ncbi:hypothetical protein Tsubulata_024232 [Turnera subulata]|uniref:Uncharacterized protein n=1 Tax=Turnera subulata TaxID=218843 RepID=A0A9Q0FD95_9ROSI|nr:hypothetical protein Tsubulata_024232 [Turnera subulata]